MFHKPLEDITVSDLQALCENRTPESKVLDYKLELPRVDHEQKKAKDRAKSEFLKDVCAFLNMDGGYLIYGIQESEPDPTGAVYAEKLKSLDLRDRSDDQWERCLSEIILNGIDPRPQHVELKFVGSSPDPRSLILRIRKSWGSPHRVSFAQANTSDFPVRVGRMTHWMNVTDIRNAVLRSDSAAQRVRSFRAKRIRDIWDLQAPVPIKEGPAIVVHLVPILSFGDLFQVDVHDAFETMRQGRALPLGSRIGEPHYNLDGVVRSYFNRAGERSTAYLQLLRDGTLETVSVEEFFHTDDSGRTYFNLCRFDQYFATFFEGSLCFLQGLQVPPPYAIMVSIVRGKNIASYIDYLYRGELPTLHTDLALVPEVVIEAVQTEDAPKTIRPVLDLVAQTFGIPRSPSYDQDGTWTPRP